MSDLERCIALLTDLVAFPSVSSDSNLAISAYIAERLTDAGARVELHPDPSGQKANLYATLGPDRPGGLILSGHTDVVPVTDQAWTSDPFRLAERDGRLYGRGSCDMKGFIAACLAKLDVLAAAAEHRPIHFALTHDEEVGCLGAQALCQLLGARNARPAMAIVGEPTELAVVEGHKGCCEYTVTFTGTSGHGSDPAAGVNAVEYAARYSAFLLEMRSQLRARAAAGQGRFQPPETTLNIGALQGGVAHNVIAAKAMVQWEMRPVCPEDEEFVKDALERFCTTVLEPEMRAVAPHCTITTQPIGEVAGLSPTKDNTARDLTFGLVGATHATVVPFGTEAGLFQAIGIDTVICGPGSIAQAHQPDEFITLTQLERCLQMLDRLPNVLAHPSDR